MVTDAERRAATVAKRRREATQVRGSGVGDQK